MPDCEGTPEFTVDELLYRRLRSDWVGADGGVRVAGISGAQSPVDLPRCSVDRESLAGGIAGVLSRAKPVETAVAAVAVRDVPEDFTHEGSRVRYRSRVVYMPLDHNAAHSEIWVRHPDEAGTPTRKPGDAFKLKIRMEIARRMTLVHPPPAPAPPVRIIY